MHDYYVLQSMDENRGDLATQGMIENPSVSTDLETAPGLTSYNLSKAYTPEWSEPDAQPPSKAFVTMKKV